LFYRVHSEQACANPDDAIPAAPAITAAIARKSLSDQEDFMGFIERSLEPVRATATASTAAVQAARSRRESKIASGGIQSMPTRPAQGSVQ
jgi:hypothetical protein